MLAEGVVITRMNRFAMALDNFSHRSHVPGLEIAPLLDLWFSVEVV